VSNKFFEHRLGGSLASPNVVDGVKRQLHHLTKPRELSHNVVEGVELLRHGMELDGEVLQRCSYLRLHLRRLAAGRQDEELIEKKKFLPKSRL